MPRPMWLKLLEMLNTISGNALRAPRKLAILKNSNMNAMFVGKEVTKLKIAIVSLTKRKTKSSRPTRKLPKQMLLSQKITLHG